MPPIPHCIVTRHLIHHRSAGERGFSLIEMTVVLLVMSVVIAGMLPLLAERTESQSAEITEDRLKMVENAIASYVAAHKELPCPADNSEGFETEDFGKADCAFDADPTDNNGVSASLGAGGVPVKALGLGDEYAFDGWGRRFTYYVDARMTAADALLDDPEEVSTSPVATPYLTIRANDGTDRATNALYAVMSHGASGHGAFLRSGQPYSAGISNAQEIENTNGDKVLVQRSLASSSVLANRFDDLVRFRTFANINLGTNAGGGSVEPEGPDGAVQFNNAGSLGGEAGFLWDDTDKVLNLSRTGANPDALLLMNAANRGDRAIDVVGISQFTGHSAAGAIQIQTDEDDQDGKMTFGREAIEGELGTAGTAGSMSNFSTAGDSVLRSINDDLILTARSAAGAIRFGTGAADTEKVTILNSGRVGIGTTNPQTMLHVAVGATGLAETQYTNAATGHTVSDGFAVGVEQNANAAYLWNYENGLFAIGTNDAERMRITNTGNVGIATDSVLGANERLAVNLASGQGTRIGPSSNDGSVALFVNSAATTQRTFIARAIAAQTAEIFKVENSAGTSQFEVTAAGVVNAAGNANVTGSVTAASFLYSSDERLKDDIDPVKEQMLQAILTLEPVRYHYKADTKKETRIGFIAQAMQKQFPELVKTDEKGMLAIDYVGLTVPLVKAGQELAEQQQALEARVVALENASVVAKAVQPEAVATPVEPAKTDQEPMLPLSQVLLIVLGVSTLQTLLFLAISRRHK